MNNDDVKYLEGVLREAVKEQIQITVNGKIDKIKTHLEEQDKILQKHSQTLNLLDQRVKPYEKFSGFFVNLKAGAVWVAGLIIPVGVILALGTWFYDKLKN